jgi:putative ABC transport system ATP-binding protein
MHILAGLDKPTSGEVTIAGTAISTLSDSDLTKLRRQHIGFIFQFFNLLPMLTAEENVLLPLSIAGVKPDREWVDQLIDRMGLTNRRTHRLSELSGGQQQRVAIGRALVSRPTIVFADEPQAISTRSERRDSRVLTGRCRARADDRDGDARARAAAIAHRVLFLADGLIVASPKDLSARDRRRDGTARQRA